MLIEVITPIWIYFSLTNSSTIHTLIIEIDFFGFLRQIPIIFTPLTSILKLI